MAVRLNPCGVRRRPHSSWYQRGSFVTDQQLRELVRTEKARSRRCQQLLYERSTSSPNAAAHNVARTARGIHGGKFSILHGKSQRRFACRFDRPDRSA